MKILNIYKSRKNSIMTLRTHHLVPVMAVSILHRASSPPPYCEANLRCRILFHSISVFISKVRPLFSIQ